MLWTAEFWTREVLPIALPWGGNPWSEGAAEAQGGVETVGAGGQVTDLQGFGQTRIDGGHGRAHGRGEVHGAVVVDAFHAVGEPLLFVVTHGLFFGQAGRQSQ